MVSGIVSSGVRYSSMMMVVIVLVFGLLFVLERYVLVAWRVLL